MHHKDLVEPVKIIRNAHPNRIIDLKYSPNGNILVSAGHDNKIRLHPVDKETEQKFILLKQSGIPVAIKLYKSPNTAYIQKLLIKPDSFKIAVATLGRGVKVTDYIDRYYRLENSVFK